MAWSREGRQDKVQQESEPPQEKAEVVARRRQHGIGSIASSPGQVIAPHSVLVLEVTDRGLYGGTSAERALDGGGEPALLARHVDLEALVLGCVVARVSGIRDNPVERGSDGALDGGNDRCERVPVIRVARQRCTWDTN